MGMFVAVPPVSTAARPAGSVKVFSLLPTRTDVPGLPNTIGRFATHADELKNSGLKVQSAILLSEAADLVQKAVAGN